MVESLEMPMMVVASVCCGVQSVRSLGCFFDMMDLVRFGHKTGEAVAFSQCC